VRDAEEDSLSYEGALRDLEAKEVALAPPPAQPGEAPRDPLQEELAKVAEERRVLEQQLREAEARLRQCQGERARIEREEERLAHAEASFWEAYNAHMRALHIACEDRDAFLSLAEVVTRHLQFLEVFLHSSSPSHSSAPLPRASGNVLPHATAAPHPASGYFPIHSPLPCVHWLWCPCLPSRSTLASWRRPSPSIPRAP